MWRHKYSLTLSTSQHCISPSKPCYHCALSSYSGSEKTVPVGVALMLSADIRQVEQLASFSTPGTASHMQFQCLRASPCRMPSVEWTSQDGKSVILSAIIMQDPSPHARVSRDVTDHLQLLLRKSGHHLHTTAEREVVRTIKEKCCYIAVNPAKEEKDTLGRVEEFRLPDGNTVQVRSSHWSSHSFRDH